MLQDNVDRPDVKSRQFPNYVVKDYRPSILTIDSPQFYEAIPTDYSNTKKRHVSAGSFSNYNQDHQDLVNLKDCRLSVKLISGKITLYVSKW